MMPDKRGTVVFFLGSPGVGKTTLTAALLSVMRDTLNLNKDIMAESLKNRRQGFLHYYLFSKYSTCEENIYDAVLNTARYAMRGNNSNNTAIIEGNFGKRLTVDMLKKHFGDLQAYDFCLVHVVCSDPDMQFDRVLKRGDAKDKVIVTRDKTYDLTIRKDFDKYIKLRMQEERACIERMSKQMRIITIDNNKELTTEQLSRTAIFLKNDIESGRPEPIRVPELEANEISVTVSDSDTEGERSSTTSTSSPNTSVTTPTSEPPEIELGNSPPIKPSSSPFVLFSARVSQLQKHSLPDKVSQPQKHHLHGDEASGRKSPRLNNQVVFG